MMTTTTLQTGIKSLSTWCCQKLKNPLEIIRLKNLKNLRNQINKSQKGKSSKMRNSKGRLRQLHQTISSKSKIPPIKEEKVEIDNTNLLSSPKYRRHSKKASQKIISLKIPGAEKKKRNIAKQGRDSNSSVNIEQQKGKGHGGLNSKYSKSFIVSHHVGIPCQNLSQISLDTLDKKVKESSSPRKRNMSEDNLSK